MNYQEAVTEGRTLVKRSEEDQWRLAELTWNVVNDGKPRAEWARDIGTGRNHATVLYSVWSHWKDLVSRGVQDRPAYIDVYNIVRGRDAESLGGMTQRETEAVTRVRNMAPERIIRDVLADPDTRAAVATELFTQPGVARRVIEDDKARSSLYVARDQFYADQATPTRDPHLETDREERQRDRAYLEATVDLNHARDYLRDALRKMIGGNLDDNQRAALLETHARVEAVSEQTKAFLQGVSLDNALEAILAGE